MKRVVLIFAIVIFMSCFVAAAPQLPHGFYGEVYYSDGSLIYENLELRAVADGEEFTYILENGKYDIVVESATEGETIYFYIEGQISSIGNYEFEFFEITELDFTSSLTKPGSSSGSSSSSGGSGGGGGGGSSTTPTLPNEEGIIDLGNGGNNEDNDAPINGENIGTGTGAVIGFFKSGKGIGLIFGLVIVILSGIILIVQKRKIK